MSFHEFSWEKKNYPLLIGQKRSSVSRRKFANFIFFVLFSILIFRIEHLIGAHATVTHCVTHGRVWAFVLKLETNEIEKPNKNDDESNSIHLNATFLNNKKNPFDRRVFRTGTLVDSFNYYYCLSNLRSLFCHVFGPEIWLYTYT